MSRSPRSRSSFVAAALVAALVWVSASEVSALPGTFTSDDFSESTLDPGRWTLIDPRGDTTLTSTGTNLLIQVAGGVSHRLTSAERTAPRVLQSVANGDVEVEMKFESQPTSGVLVQGIVFQQDEMNLVAFGLEHDGTGLVHQVTTLTAGRAKVTLRSPAPSAGTSFLRVARVGTACTLRSSSDGAAWTTVGTVACAQQVSSIGPFAGNHSVSGPAPAFTASVDYAFDVAAPIVPEDGEEPNDTTPPEITGLSVTPSRTSAIVSWTTTEAADSSVDVGTTESYELGTVTDPAFVTSHQVTLSGLDCETTHHIRTTSVDPAGNASSQHVMSFVTTSCTEPPRSTLASDDLSGPSLDTGRWSVTDPNGRASITMTGSAAAVSIPAGTAHGFAGGVNRTARLTQSVNDEDLEIDVAFEQPLASANGTALYGLLIEQDQDDYLRFEVSTAGCEFKIYAGVQSGSTLTHRLSRTVQIAPTHLRAHRAGALWLLSVSYDGLAWSRMAGFTDDLTPMAVGPYVGSEGASAPAVTGAIDYVVDRAEPFGSEDGTAFEAVPQDPVIDLWYGPSQTFGMSGRPQTLVNVLGSVSDPDGVASLTYAVNGGPPAPLPLGMDPGRLSRPGDFNVELPWSALAEGPNVVSLTAADRLGNGSSIDATVHVTGGSTPPADLDVGWSAASAIGEVAQVVDGRWAIQGDGVRTLATGYDRLIAIGDTSWTSYEVTVPITIHGYGAGSCAGPAVGLALGWSGHTGSAQPRIGHPYGALGWYRGALEIKRNGDATVARDRTRRQLAVGTPYIFKMQMERVSTAPLLYTYRLRVWAASDPEPGTWNLTYSYDVGGGSVLLVAHHTDASFGPVTVRPLGSA